MRNVECGMRSGVLDFQVAATGLRGAPHFSGLKVRGAPSDWKLLASETPALLWLALAPLLRPFPSAGRLPVFLRLASEAQSRSVRLEIAGRRDAGPTSAGIGTPFGIFAPFRHQSPVVLKCCSYGKPEKIYGR